MAHMAFIIAQNLRPHYDASHICDENSHSPAERPGWSRRRRDHRGNELARITALKRTGVGRPGRRARQLDRLELWRWPRWVTSCAARALKCIESGDRFR